MARSAATDRQFLEQHNGKWRVSIAVPRQLQGTLGTRLKRPLQTDSLAVANGMKWAVVAELRAAIEQARGHSVGKDDPLVKEALEIAKLRERAQTEEEREGLDDAVSARIDHLLGNPVEDDLHTPVYDEAKEQRAKLYAAISHGRATPIAIHHESFIKAAGNKRRTEGDDRRAINYLLAWCERERVPPVLQAITHRVAVRFMDDLPELAARGQSVNAGKKMHRRAGAKMHRGG